MDHRSSTNLPGRWLGMARSAWALIALSSIGAFGAASILRYAEYLHDPYALGPYLGQLGLSLRFFAIYATFLDGAAALVFFIIGVVIFWRRSDDWLAILVSVALLLLPVSILPVTGALAERGAMWATLVMLFRMLGGYTLFLVFFLFPDGRFVPVWTRLIAVGMAVYFLLWLPFPALAPRNSLVGTRTSLEIAVVAVVTLMLALAVAAQLYRYRRVSAGVQRQQTKWVVLAFAGAFTGFAAAVVPYLLLPALRTPGLFSTRFVLAEVAVVLFSLSLIPVGIGLSILRYRLWDIDIIVRRTLLYAILTALLLLVYFGGVVLLQQAMRRFAGGESPLAIVITTLGIAVLFIPLRRRVQDLIDRRFYRRKYDAARTLEAFTRAARDEVDLGRLTGSLVRVVQDTLEPRRADLWLVQARPSGPGSEAARPGSENGEAR